MLQGLYKGGGKGFCMQCLLKPSFWMILSIKLYLAMGKSIVSGKYFLRLVFVRFQAAVFQNEILRDSNYNSILFFP